MSYNQLVAASYARLNGDGNNDGTPDVLDASVNGYHGSWGGGGTPGYGTGLWGGNSFAFDGNTEIAATIGTGGITYKCMGVWCKAPDLSDSDRNIINIGVSSTTKLGVRLQVNGAVKFPVNTAATTNGSGYDDGNWHHYGVIDDGTTAKLLVDGVELDSVAGAGAYNQSTKEINLGSNNFGFRMAAAGTEMFDAVWQCNNGTGDLWTASDIAELMAGPEPVNTVIPTLSIDSSGNWIGTVGTWTLPAPFSLGSNGTVTYAWELRLDSDDSVVSSGSGASPSGSGLVAGTDYYLRVVASNDGGSDLPADSAVESYAAPTEATGTLTATLAGVSAVAAGEQINAGSLAATLAGVSGVAAAEQVNDGSVAASLGGVSGVASGEQVNQAALSASLGGVTGSAAAEQINSAELATTLDGVSASASVEQSNSGTLASTLDGVSVVADVNALIDAALAAALGGVSASASGEQVNAASLAAVLSGVSVAAVADFGDSVNGTLTKNLTGVSGSATGEQTNGASLAAILAGVTATASGEQTNEASLAKSLVGVTVAATVVGESGIGASLAVALAGASASSQAALAIRSQIGATLQGVTVSARSSDGQTSIAHYYYFLGA